MRFVKGLRGVQLVTKQAQNALPFQLAVGQVHEVSGASTRKVKVLKMEMNDYLKMYFNKSYLLNTIDDKNISKKGDIVLLKQLKNPESQTEMFAIENILFKIDDIVDPITGKRATENSEILAKHLENLSKTLTK